MRRNGALFAVYVVLMAAYASARSLVGFADVHDNDQMRFVAADALRLGHEGTAAYLDPVIPTLLRIPALTAAWSIRWRVQWIWGAPPTI